MMAEEFERAVDDGLRLAKRLYFGKDRAVAPPRPMSAMEKISHSFLPGGPMLYAVIGNPAIVDNPDIPSYQPHVHGRCDPPALIPLQMNDVSLEVECYLDSAFVTLTGSWRVHCVMGARSCDCRIAIPMGEEGSILGLEVEVPGKSYRTQLSADDDDQRDMSKVAKIEDGGYLTPNIFALTIPQVYGGSNISIKARWSQKVVYNDGQFTLSVPFTFPEYVTPAGKKIAKKEKIQLNVNTGPETEVLCNTSSHPMKERRREAGKLGFSYESDVLTWSSSDFLFMYNIPSTHISGGVLLQSPAMLDGDRRETFCCYIYPGERKRNAFKKEVVFVVDISGSMRGKPLESIKNALFAAVAKLDPQDLFNVIAFNGDSYQYSSSLEPVTKEAIEKLTEWVNMNFVAGGGTNILHSLNKALEMLSKSQNSIPSVLLITDGAVEDEKQICDVVKSQLTSQKTTCPRIHTFGIGSFCNHQFLRMLAMISRGYYEAALDPDSIEIRMEALFARVSSIVLANISFEFDDLDDLEVYPSQVPDLSSQSILVISGRYRGTFPDNIKAKGILANMGPFSVDLKVQESKDTLLSKVIAKQQIEVLTAQVWLTENKELEEKVAKISVQNGVVSEYTQMILIETAKEANTGSAAQKKVEDPKNEKITLLHNLGVGFGNLTATAENTPPGSKETKPPEAAEIIAKAASNCCGKICNCCCGMCCIRTCSRMNDQFAIVLTQFCGGLACLGCFACCELCCPKD